MIAADRSGVVAGAAPNAPSPSRDTAGGKPLRTLVVEDCADMRRALAKLLRLRGHEVEAADDGPSGLDAARATRPEVVILDVGLRGFDGHELARRVRAEAFGRDALLVVLTGFDHDAARARSREAGADHHLVKPVAFEELASLLDGWADRRPIAPPAP